MLTESVDSIDAFRCRFEAHAKASSWPTGNWPILLSYILEGRLLSLFHSLNVSGNVDYDTLKECLKEHDRKKTEDLVQNAEAFQLVHPSKNLTRRVESPPVRLVATNAGRGQQYFGTVRGNRPFNPRGSFHFPGSEGVQNVTSQDNYTRGQKSGHGHGRGRLASPDTQCFTCCGYGHFTRNCPSNTGLVGGAEQFAHMASVAVSIVKEEPQLGVLCSADGRCGYLPLVDGVVNGFHVSVLRDSGATTAGVRRILVRDDQFTGETQRVISFGGRLESFPLAQVQVDTFFSGDLICSVID